MLVSPITSRSEFLVASPTAEEKKTDESVLHDPETVPWHPFAFKPGKPF